MVDGDVIDDALVWEYNHTFVMFTMPPGLGNRNVSLSVAGQRPTLNPRTAIHFDPPLLFNMTPNLTTTDGGVLVNLTGANFGTPAMSHVALMFVKFHHSVCTLLAVDCSREQLCDCTVVTHTHEYIVVRCVCLIDAG
jgi:hypothetical protein